MTNHKILLKDCEIFQEVDHKKNKHIDFDTLAYRSATKIWWLCKEKGHSFQATCHHRTRGSGCPGCSKHSRLITFEKSLAFLKPNLAKMWHPTKNGNLKPKNISAASGKKKYWFICEYGHEFQSTTNNKKNEERLCSYCSKRLASKDYNFSKKFPHLLSQWDFDKNKKKPDDFTPHSNSKVWWVCKKGHSYKQSIGQKTVQHQGCNICNANISKPQLRIFTELKYIFEGIVFNKKIKSIEIDVYIPDLKVGIEYDGGYYHKNREGADLEKNKKLLKLGIKLIRVREKILKKLSTNDISLKSSVFKKKDLDNIVKKIIDISEINKNNSKIINYLSSNTFLNEKIFNNYILNLPFPLFEKSLEFTHPELSNEWDFVKNEKLRPNQFLASNHTKVWWICKKYNHNWKASISDRAYKNAGCRICSDFNRKKRFIDMNKKRKGISKDKWSEINN